MEENKDVVKEEVVTPPVADTNADEEETSFTLNLLQASKSIVSIVSIFIILLSNLTYYFKLLLYKNIAK